MARANRSDIRLDAPKGLRDRSSRRATAPSRDRFGRFTEAIARGMGTPWFLVGLTLFVVAWIALQHARSRGPALRLRGDRLHGADPRPVAAGLVRRAPDPARAEPPGRPRPRADRAGPPARRAQPRRHRVPRPRGRRAAARDARTWRRRTSSAPSCARCSRSSTSARDDRDDEIGHERRHAVMPADASTRSSSRGAACWPRSPRVIDPEIRKPITELDMVGGCRGRRRAARVDVGIKLTIVGCPAADRIERDVLRGRRGRRRAPARRPSTSRS